VVEVVGLRKQFEAEHGAVHALDGVSFTVPEGSLFTLLGPSGCGKTTSLRSIAGLERPDSGLIRIGDRTVFDGDSGVFVPPEQRQIGMVFQSYAIWPHMTVFDNVAYPLRGRGLSKAEMQRRVGDVLDLVGLGDLARRPAPNLSGGQQQRVALARALVADPRVLLLDEPLSNLDAKLRQQMRTEIRRLQRLSGVTAVYVTHDQEEALAVSDELVFMMDGQIVERGRPEDLYLRPQSRLTADLLGEANFLPGRVAQRNGRYATVEVPGGTLLCPAPAGGEAAVTVFFRPETPRVELAEPSAGPYLRGVVRDTLFLGKSVTCWVTVGPADEVKVAVPSVRYPQAGEAVYLVLDPEACAVFA
jgi:iron(III) transport system ATP-binding protein